MAASRRGTTAPRSPNSASSRASTRARSAASRAARLSAFTLILSRWREGRQGHAPLGPFRQGAHPELGLIEPALGVASQANALLEGSKGLLQRQLAGLQALHQALQALDGAGEIRRLRRCFLLGIGPLAALPHRFPR